MKKYKFKSIRLIVAGSLVFCMAGCVKKYDYDFSTQDGINRYTIDWNKAADSSTGFLINNYWNASPGYFNKSNVDPVFNYWPQAHGLDVLVDAYTRTGSDHYKTLMSQWFKGVKQKNGNTFINHFYDDMNWNALALLRAYMATKDDSYKEAAQSVWTDIKTGWNDKEGGGIAWNKSQTSYKNTPANAPAAILAARLYQQFKNTEDLNWAEKIYKYQKDSLYNASTGFVYDGLNANGDGQRSDWAFTYNQGVMIGAALELYHITKDPVYLNDATTIADHTLNSSDLTTADRLLKDEGEGDGGLFKGVFVRYFTQLILEPDLEEAIRKRYLSFFKLNAETLWFAGTNKTLGLFGTYWNTAPAATSDLTTEESGAILIEAAALLHKNNLL